MKYRCLRFAAIAAIVAGVGLARLSAVTLGVNDLLGTVVPGTPADGPNALEQVKFLVNAYNSTTPVYPSGYNLGDNPLDAPLNPNPNQLEVYTLYRPLGAPAVLPTPTTTGSLNSDNGKSPVVDLNGQAFTYILFFQANSAWIYYIGNIAGTEDINWGGDPIAPQNNTSGKEISHYYLFNPVPGVPTHHNVPDGGTTVLLVGAGILLTGLTVRAKKSA